MFCLSSPRASKLAVQRQGGCFDSSITPTRTPQSASQLPSRCMATWSSTLALALISRRCRPKPRLGLRCVSQKILEVLESLEDIPSPHFVSGEDTKSGVIVKGSDSEPLSWPMDVEPLLEVCTQAECGRGSETVTDLSVRSVMETQRVKVEWPELPEVLNEVERKLLPDTILRAEFDKLLVYRPGDFFKGHRDSKRSDNHVATLIAIAGCPHKGGAVVFREADEEVALWEGGCGSWCCWLTSSKHEIQPILEGHRIVATYKVLAEPGSTISVDPNAVALAERLNECIPELKTLLQEKRLRDAGFLLHHDYSFDGRPHMDFRRLVGRDRTLWLALELLGLELQVREVKLVHEVLDNDDGEPTQRKCRVAEEVQYVDGHPLDWLLLDDEQDLWSDGELRVELTKDAADFFRVKKLRAADAHKVVFFARTDWDDAHVGFWPVMGCLWCISRDKLLHKFRSSSFEGVEDELWGNEGTFSIYWYKAAALMARIRADDSVCCDDDIDLED